MPLTERAPAKVNLSLHVLGRRADGFHELDSVVAFAGCAADVVTLEPERDLALAAVDGPFAPAAGPDTDNLVLKAARAAAERVEGLRLGAFGLTKRIPVAAGLGGGSADAGAALRLIARLNGLPSDDPRLVEAAAATGSDVPVCLRSCAARMTGRGEGVEPVDLPPLAAVLANPLKGLSTADVFRGLGLAPGAGDFPVASGSGSSAAELHALRSPPYPPLGEGRDPATSTPDNESRRDKTERDPSPCKGEGTVGIAQDEATPLTDLYPIPLEELISARNDLEPPARALMTDIALGIDALSATDGCRLARMSGSGATVFGLFEDQRAARRGARALRARLPGWWIRPSMLR